jgi:hypothetical protein
VVMGQFEECPRKECAGLIKARLLKLGQDFDAVAAVSSREMREKIHDIVLVIDKIRAFAARILRSWKADSLTLPLGPLQYWAVRVYGDQLPAKVRQHAVQSVEEERMVRGFGLVVITP